LALAKEEIDHFEQVHNIIIKRGLKLGRERKDHYVNELYLYMKKVQTEAEYLVLWNGYCFRQW
jgi:tRNA isopentenyl-2-thiomethyl-A-37 hydroxylase MiaE